MSNFVASRRAGFCDAFARVPRSAATPAALSDCIQRQPAIYRRNEVSWIAVHRWRTGYRIAGLAALERAARRLDRAVIETAASSVAALLDELFGVSPDVVTSAPGAAFGESLARRIAEMLELPFLDVFAEQSMAAPAASPLSVLIVADLADSGRRLEEAMLAICATGATATAIAWIAGEASGGKPIAEPPPSLVFAV
jgi:hypothetical protein